MQSARQPYDDAMMSLIVNGDDFGEREAEMRALCDAFLRDGLAASSIRLASHHDLGSLLKEVSA